MSQWGVAQVAAWASDAGWAGDSLATAVAVAMAFSEGNDHATTNPAHVPALERRGLYGLTAAEAGPVDWPALFDPVRATWAAHRYWQDMGGVWTWHPCWASGAVLAARPAVEAVLAHGEKVKAGTLGYSFATRIDRMHRLRTAVSQWRRL